MRGSRSRRSRSWSSLCPTCLRRMCPPAASSWLRSRTGPDGRTSARSAIAEDGAELAPFVAGGGWHESRPHSPSGNTMRMITARIAESSVIEPQITAASVSRFPAVIPGSHPVQFRFCNSYDLKSSGNCATKQGVRASVLDSLDDFERWGKEDDCAYVFPRGYRHERWSYQRVAEVAYQFARELEARNIARGDAVLLWSPNCAEWVAAFLGCALCGVIAVPVDDGASPDLARRISAQVRTRLVLCPRDRAAFFAAGSAVAGKAITIDPSDLMAAVAE